MPAGGARQPHFSRTPRTFRHLRGQTPLKAAPHKGKGLPLLPPGSEGALRGQSGAGRSSPTSPRRPRPGRPRGSRRGRRCPGRALTEVQELLHGEGRGREAGVEVHLLRQPGRRHAAPQRPQQPHGGPAQAGPTAILRPAQLAPPRAAQRRLTPGGGRGGEGAGDAGLPLARRLRGVGRGPAGAL